ncbi:MAG: hypothetical protein WKF92_02930 [Pyrinomonadaceae bacterium]
MQSGNENIQTRDSRQGWNAEDLADQGSQINEDEIQRQVLRGDESNGEPDDRDNAGRVESKDTPQGREEAKPDHKGAANDNG